MDQRKLKVCNIQLLVESSPGFSVCSGWILHSARQSQPEDWSLSV